MPPPRSTAAVIAVVVVLPCVPQIAMPRRPSMMRRSISPRRTIGMPCSAARRYSGFCGSIAELTTTARAPLTLRVSCPIGNRGARVAHSSISGESETSEPRDAFAPSQQYASDRAHADAADADEVQTAGLTHGDLFRDVSASIRARIAVTGSPVASERAAARIAARRWGSITSRSFHHSASALRSLSAMTHAAPPDSKARAFAV